MIFETDVKKLISVILVICMMTGFLAMMPASAAATYGYVLGDVNDDGIINLNLTAADADKDGKLLANDIALIRKISMALITVEGNNTDNRFNVNIVTVDNRNISRYTIVIPSVMEDPNIEGSYEYAASELQKYISNACGITLNITTDAAEVDGYKIKYIIDKEDKFGLGKEGFHFEVEDGGDIAFYCGSMRGQHYATYYFLEEFIGYRFIIGEKEGYRDDPTVRGTGSVEYLFKDDHINIPAGFAETEVPYFIYRNVCQGGVSEDNFLKHRFNGTEGGSQSCTRPDYGWGVGTLFIFGHSYEYQCGIPWTEQPCLTAEKTYDQIIAYSINLIDTRESLGSHLGYAYTQITVSPNDNTNFCYCADCKKVYDDEGSIAGTVFRLSNRCAETLDALYPGIEISTLAYWDARNPPSMTRPHDNVCVGYCMSGCNNHSYDKADECEACGGNPRYLNGTYTGNRAPASNVTEVDYLMRWCELTDNIYVYYYSANFAYYLAPTPNLFNIYNDIKFLASCGISGMFIEGMGFNIDWIRGTLAGKMLWNPFMSEEEFEGLFNEYLMAYYGEGWQYIKDYIYMSNEAGDVNGCWLNNFDWPFDMYSEEYFAENYLEMADLLDKACVVASTDEYRFRVLLLSLHCHWLGLSATYERDYLNGDSAVKAVYEERYNSLRDTIVTYEIALTRMINRDGYDKYGCDNFPNFDTGVVNPMTWFTEGFTGKRN